jgi:[ribosomal protein S5]-alanine N-acetyltransferase
MGKSLLSEKGVFSVNQEQAPVYLRSLEAGDLEALYQLRARNREFFTPFEPVSTDAAWTREAMVAEIQRLTQGREADTLHSYGIFLRETDELIGRVTLSNVSRRAFQNCTVGYYVGEEHNGKGYMTAALKQVVRIAFEELGLHRVSAGVMTRNERSARVLEKAGFRFEGLALHYLQIHGVWEDHKLYAVTREDYDAQQA